MNDKVERTLIIVIDAIDPTLDIEEVRRFITESSEISNWWNHIPGTYIVRTTLGADELSDRLKQHTGDVRFLVIGVDPAESDGWLPERAWRWIHRRSRESAGTVAAN